MPTPLPPLARHTASAATAINDAGRAVGISGYCDRAIGRRSAESAVVWDRGTAWELDDLGGFAWNTPMSLNANGDIVGFLNGAQPTGPRSARSPPCGRPTGPCTR